MRRKPQTEPFVSEHFETGTGTSKLHLLEPMEQERVNVIIELGCIYFDLSLNMGVSISIYH